MKKDSQGNRIDLLGYALALGNFNHDDNQGKNDIVFFRIKNEFLSNRNSCQCTKIR